MEKATMQQLFSQLPQATIPHWVDALLFCLLLFYAVEGFFAGAIYALFDFLKFVLSFLLGLLFYAAVGHLLTQILHIPTGYANAIGFFLVAFVTELVLQIALKKPIKMVNTKILSSGPIMVKVNNIIGILPGLLSGVVLVMFIVTVLTALPVSPFVRRAISDSHIGSFFATRSQLLQKDVAGVFGGAAEETLNFLTVEPQSNSSVSLGFTTTKGIVDTAAEKDMLRAVNQERTSRGISPLSLDSSLQGLARDYGQEMLTHGYFSHYSPDGLSPFDRMNQRNITYTFAGENLAFSANTTLAMQGLMNSPGHRDNILSTHYRKVGIGVIDAGIYGEMFVQEFTD